MLEKIKLIFPEVKFRSNDLNEYRYSYAPNCSLEIIQYHKYYDPIYLFHEVAHASGHRKRLDRFLDEKVTYGFEECVAQITALNICRRLHICDDSYYSLTDRYLNKYNYSSYNTAGLVDIYSDIATQYILFTHQ